MLCTLMLAQLKDYYCRGPGAVSPNNHEVWRSAEGSGGLLSSSSRRADLFSDHFQISICVPFRNETYDQERDQRPNRIKIITYVTNS